MQEVVPRVSFGVPVRNGEAFIDRALGSLAAQDLREIEVVIVDNASTDRTPEICRTYSSTDARFRYMRQEADVGQIENFNAAFRHARGRYFRWVGADDFLSPQYASQCATLLDENPDAVGVTTLWRFCGAAAPARAAGRGRGMDCSDPVRRLASFLRLLQSDKTAFDPIYSLLRADALKATHLLQITPATDVLLALELCLSGPFRHVDLELAKRRLDARPKHERSSEYHPSLRGVGRLSLARRYRSYASTVQNAPLSARQKQIGRALVGLFWVRAVGRRAFQLGARASRRAGRWLRRRPHWTEGRVDG